MSNLYFCLLILMFWLIGGTSSLKAVVSFLLVCSFLSFSLVMSSGWKGYLIIFVFVGGLLVFIMYFASLTKWSETVYSFFWVMMGSTFLVLESKEIFSESSVVSFYLKGVMEFWMSIFLFIFICLILSQLLFSEKTLRAFF